MEKENKTKEIKITVRNSDVGISVGADLSFSDVRYATLGLLAFAFKFGAEVKEVIEQELGRKYKGNFKEDFVNMLYDWVDKVCREDYEPRQDN